MAHGRTGLRLVAVPLLAAGLPAAPDGPTAAPAEDTARVWVAAGYRYLPAGARTTIEFGVRGGARTVRIDARSLAGVTVAGLAGKGCGLGPVGGACTFDQAGGEARVTLRAAAGASAGPAGRLLFRLGAESEVSASVLIDVRVGGDVTDLAVTAPDAAGRVGQAVAVPVTVENRGPNTSPHWEVHLGTVPDGVAFVGGAGCERGPSGIVCAGAPNMWAGTRQTVRPTFRIASAGTTVAVAITLRTPLADPNPANEDRAFVVRGPAVANPAPVAGDAGRTPAAVAPTRGPPQAGVVPPDTSRTAEPSIVDAPEVPDTSVAIRRTDVRRAALVVGAALALLGAAILAGFGLVAIRRRRAGSPRPRLWLRDLPAPTGAVESRFALKIARARAAAAARWTQLPVVGSGWDRPDAVTGQEYAPTAEPPRARAEAERSART